MLTLVASALARAATQLTTPTCCAPGEPTRDAWAASVLAPSMVGTFLAASRGLDHVRQLDRVSRELLAPAWSAGAGPGDGHSPSTWIRRSARHTVWQGGGADHGYTGKRGVVTRCGRGRWHRNVLARRCAEGRANTARGAAHFLRETVGRVRYAGARGPSRCGPTAASTTPSSRLPTEDVALFLAPSARVTSCADRGHTCFNTGRASPDWMDRRRRATATLRPVHEPCRAGQSGSRSGAYEQRCRFRQVGPLGHLQLSRLHHRGREETPGSRGDHRSHDEI